MPIELYDGFPPAELLRQFHQLLTELPTLPSEPTELDDFSEQVAGLEEAQTQYEAINPDTETSDERRARYEDATRDRLRSIAATEQYMEATRDEAVREQAANDDFHHGICDVFRLGREILSYSGVRGGDRADMLALLAHGRDNDPMPFNADLDPVDDSMESLRARAVWPFGAEPKIKRAIAATERLRQTHLRLSRPGSMSAAGQPANCPPSSSGSDTNHSEDFTSVNWFGSKYTFDAGQQAKAVGLLWAEFEKGEHGLAERTIGEQIGSNSNNYRLAHTFRIKNKRKGRGQPGFLPHPAWGAMIQKAGSGVYRLARPESRQNPI